MRNLPMTDPVHRRRSTCRICDGSRLHLVLSLGQTPLANAFLSAPNEFDTEPRFPLELYFCETCTFLQLLDVVAPEVLFRHYVYASGTSDTIAAHNRALAAAVVTQLGIGAGDLVVEIASNDGSLLKRFCDHDTRVLGIEPASNIAQMAREAGIDTIDEFFTPAIAARVRASHGPAAAIVANNVLAHVDDPRDFLRGARSLLRPGGAIVVEVPYVGELLERLEYDTVYHEHLGYFSIHAFLALAEAAALSVERVDRVAVHGGSLRVWFRDRQEVPSHSAAVMTLVEEERRAGLHTVDRYERFRIQVEGNRESLRQLLQQLVDSGKTIAGYGAPAKGNTLLSYCGIDGRLLPYTVDKSPLKVGLYTPGTHIPVLPVSILAERRPDYLLVLAWNFADEIMRQQADYRANGGRFILPIPQPTVV
jgi:SAM-dependent methyltransferase